MKLKRFNEDNVGGYGKTKVNLDIPSEEQYINLCYIKEFSEYTNLETGELMKLSEVKNRYNWLVSKQNK